MVLCEILEDAYPASVAALLTTVDRLVEAKDLEALLAAAGRWCGDGTVDGGFPPVAAVVRRKRLEIFPVREDLRWGKGGLLAVVVVVVVVVRGGWEGGWGVVVT